MRANFDLGSDNAVVTASRDGSKLELSLLVNE